MQRRSRTAYRSAIAALVLACLVAGLMQTIVIPLQAELPELLGAPRGVTAWVVTATAAGAAILSPICGRLGDLYGRKRAAVGVMAVFAVGSVVAAIAPGAGFVIAGRALQGAAISVIPLTVAILRDLVSRERLPVVIAIASGMLGGGAAFGMPIGALISRWLDWHWLFWFCAILGAVSVAWVAISVPPLRAGTKGRFDLVGAVGTATGSGALLLGIGQGLEWGWTSPPVLVLIAGGGAVLVLANLWMLRVRDPMIDVRVAMRRPVVLTNVSALSINFANMGANVILPQLLTQPRLVGLGVDPISASVVMMLAAVSQLLATPLVAVLGRRAGPRVMLILGATLGAVAIGVPAFAPPGVALVAAANALIGAGFAFVFAAFPQIVTASVPSTQIAAANGLNTQIRTFGTAGGAAIAGALLATLSVDGTPTSAAYTVSLMVCAIAALVGAAIGLAIPWNHRREQSRMRSMNRKDVTSALDAAVGSPLTVDERLLEGEFHDRLGTDRQ